MSSSKPHDDYVWLSTIRGLETSDRFRAEIIEFCTPETKGTSENEFSWEAPEGRVVVARWLPEHQVLEVDLRWGNDRKPEVSADVYEYFDRITTRPDKPLTFSKWRSRLSPGGAGSGLRLRSQNWPSSGEEIAGYAQGICLFVAPLSPGHLLPSAPDMAQTSKWNDAVALSRGATMSQLIVKRLQGLGGNPLRPASPQRRASSGSYRPAGARPRGHY